MKPTLLVLILLTLASGFTGKEDAPTRQKQELPNILWISAEDLSPRLAAYGDSTISTPNIDRLAREGVVYENVYTAAGVCSPSRNSIITGRYQTSNGGHNMRTLYNTYPEKTGLPKSYNTVPPVEVKCFPEYLRAAGYYTTNNFKTDYQFEAPPTVWDEVSKTADWRGRAPGQPFFCVMNFETTHESQIWARADHPMRVALDKVPLPPYYPDDRISRRDVARHYSNISELDEQIGGVLARLEEDGLLENTLIFFWTDHGDGLPFYKREIYRRGLHVPLIIRYPGKAKAGTRDKRFISAIDLGPTVLSLAGIPTPEQMHGRPFLGKYTKKEHPYIFAARDRIDSEYDRVRSVMDKQFQYIRNFEPEKPLYMDIEYRKGIPLMKHLLDLNEQGKLNEHQSLWFKSVKPKEELYDWTIDPFQLNNLAENPAYEKVLLRLREVLNVWIRETQDLGAVSEKELVSQMWNGQSKSPKTITPEARISTTLELASKTQGASIGYRKLGEKKWNVYSKPLDQIKGTIEVIAMRIGYEPSDTLRVNF